MCGMELTDAPSNVSQEIVGSGEPYAEHGIVAPRSFENSTEGLGSVTNTGPWLSGLDTVNTETKKKLRSWGVHRGEKLAYSHPLDASWCFRNDVIRKDLDVLGVEDLIVKLTRRKNNTRLIQHPIPEAISLSDEWMKKLRLKRKRPLDGLRINFIFFILRQGWWTPCSLAPSSDNVRWLFP